MIYHLNSFFANPLDSIQNAAVLRSRIFAEQNIASKILTLEYNVEQNFYFGKNAPGIEFENMYDFFQRKKEYNRKPIMIYDIFKDEEYTYNEKEEGLIEVRKGNLYIALVELREDKSIRKIHYWSGERWAKIEVYDEKGFLSSEKIWHLGEILLIEKYFDIDGNMVIEKYYDSKENNKIPIRIILKERDGKIKIFFSENELQIYFLNTFLEDGDILIDDYIWGHSLEGIKENTKIISVIHDGTIATDKPGEISRAYSPLLTKKYNSRIVVQTEMMKEEFEKNFAFDKEFLNTIPVGFRKDNRRISVENGDKIIFIAFLFSAKRPKDAIQAFAYIKNEIKGAELHIYGNFNDKELPRSELYKLVNELGVEDSLYFRGFIQDMEKEYDDAKLMLCTSQKEAFGLGILEAISLGIPVVSYDIKYGPKELIIDGETGFLTKEEPLELAKKAIELLSDKAKYEEFSKNAYAHSFLFSKENYIEKWMNLLKEVEKEI